MSLLMLGRLWIGKLKIQTTALSVTRSFASIDELKNEIRLPTGFFDAISEKARPQEKGSASGIYIGSSPPKWRELLELSRASHPARTPALRSAKLKRGRMHAAAVARTKEIQKRHIMSAHERKMALRSQRAAIKRDWDPRIRLRGL